MNSDLKARVLAMVSEFTCVQPLEITQETTLFYDLGIDGDDAVEFFEEFERAFRVDLTDFKIEKHFGTEASEPLSSIMTWLQGWWTKNHDSAAGVVPISVHDLVEAARLGRWVKT
jgi:acyl carrier protein